jgi:hypothetical protein
MRVNAFIRNEDLSVDEQWQVGGSADMHQLLKAGQRQRGGAVKDGIARAIPPSTPQRGARCILGIPAPSTEPKHFHLTEDAVIYAIEDSQHRIGIGIALEDLIRGLIVQFRKGRRQPT